MTTDAQFPARPRATGNQPLIRIAVLAGLVVFSWIPIAVIDLLVSERQERRDAAAREVGAAWGSHQVLSGPALVVPYVTRPTRNVNGVAVQTEETSYATFYPESVNARGRLEVEKRRRGIYSVPVYRARWEVEGAFRPPTFPGIPAADIRWEGAHLVIGVSDVHALQGPETIRWGGGEADLQPGTGESGAYASGVHALVPVGPGAGRIPFRFPLQLLGSTGAYWRPVGRTTHVTLASNWAHPSFRGVRLPERRRVDRGGFEAEWTMSHLAQVKPQVSARSRRVEPPDEREAALGVDLIEPVDQYQRTSRSVKYAGFFLALTFAMVWLVEVRQGVRVHPLQYILIGCAMGVFYLLELSLSEHLGFGPAYVVAAAAVVAQIGAYSAAVLGTLRRGLSVGGMVAVLYGYLYIVLTNEDYALLIGSLGVFAMLAAIMYLTRRVDWYALGRAPARGAETAP